MTSGCAAFTPDTIAVSAATDAARMNARVERIRDAARIRRRTPGYRERRRAAPTAFQRGQLRDLLDLQRDQVADQVGRVGVGGGADLGRQVIAPIAADIIVTLNWPGT